MISKKVLEQSKNFPKNAGVYIMKDDFGKIIYIGKAKNLKNRIKNYFQGQDKRITVGFLINKVANLEYIITGNEEEAFLLERELIKKYKPKYNILLKDDKAYLSVKIDIKKDFPKIECVRKIKDDGSLYFGPFSQSGRLKEILELIKELIPLRTCSDVSFSNRVRPCLEYQINRCTAPCKKLISKEEYQEHLNQAIKILEGKATNVLNDLKVKMEEYSTHLLFENAAKLRDKIQILEDYQKNIHLKSHRGESRDFFAFYRDNNFLSLCVMKEEGTKLIDSKTYKIENVFLDDDELAEEIIIDYYENISTLPKEIILNVNLKGDDFLKKSLKNIFNITPEITAPQKGDKFRILNLALLNAKKAYSVFFESDEIYKNIAKNLKLKFNLKKYPKVVECVDISNLQSSDIVGGIVVFYEGIPQKKLYKKYILKEKIQNDFESIYEVIYRRLSRGIKENDLPDLIIIDGGDKQLNKALEARNKLNLSLDIISIAKFRTSHLKPERVFLDGKSDPIELSMNDSLSFFMQRIRDAAHDNVIGFHRERREKRVISSKLDNILGIGETRKHFLLSHFKSTENIKNATEEEISKVCNVSKTLAKKIKEEC